VALDRGPTQQALTAGVGGATVRTPTHHVRGVVVRLLYSGGALSGAGAPRSITVRTTASDGSLQIAQ
jgi:hypothetical protein